MFQLGGHARPPALLAFFASLLNSPDVDIRRSAASGLRGIGTTASIKPLASVLHDSDPTVRYYAASGLALIAGGPGSLMSMAYFQQHEQEETARWEAWSKQADTPPRGTRAAFEVGTVR